MDDRIFLALITLAGVIVTAVVTWSIAQRRIAMEYVTAERTKWRKKIRKLALRGHNEILKGDEAGVRRIRSELSVLLNPFCDKDREILVHMIADGSKTIREIRAQAFIRRISLLLKHDWERAKLEARWFLCRWTLDARRHGLKSVEGTKCECRGENDQSWYHQFVLCYRRFTFRYRVKRLQAGVLVVVLIVALGTIACVLCHCF